MLPESIPVEQYRRELLAHCYRILGSQADAEDALQEALLHAWRGLPRFQGRSSLRSWLYRITTNACLRTIERRPKLPLIEPRPDAQIAFDAGVDPAVSYERREAIELAFTATVQCLPARQRAALILRDVFAFTARETAAVLETTPAAIDSALQRAHMKVDEWAPSQSQQQTLHHLSDETLSRLVERYITAWERNDVDALVSMLAEDAKGCAAAKRTAP